MTGPRRGRLASRLVAVTGSLALLVAMFPVTALAQLPPGWGEEAPPPPPPPAAESPAPEGDPKPAEEAPALPPGWTQESSTPGGATAATDKAGDPSPNVTFTKVREDICSGPTGCPPQPEPLLAGTDDARFTITAKHIGGFSSNAFRNVVLTDPTCDSISVVKTGAFSSVLGSGETWTWTCVVNGSSLSPPEVLNTAVLTLDECNTNNQSTCQNGTTIDSWTHTANESAQVVAPAPNPVLQDSCSLDISLIVDSSGSVAEAGAVDQVKTALTNFFDSLEDTGSTASIVDFDTFANVVVPPTVIASFSTSPGGVFANYIANYSAGGGTNWAEAFYDAQSLPTPDVVLFITDGRPTFSNGPTAFDQAQGPWDGGIGLNPGQTTQPWERARAVFQANVLKNNGAHIFLVGVGTAIGNPSANDLLSIESVTGPVEFPDDGQPFGASDYSLITDFDALSASLRNIVTQVCRSSVTLRKFVDDQPASGFEFTADVGSPPPSGTAYTWLQPAGTAGVPQSTTTDVNGFATFQVSPNQPTQSSRFVITESLPANQQLESVSCTYSTETLSDQPLTPDSVNTSTGQFVLTVENNWIVTCRVDNSTLPEADLSITKTDNPDPVTAGSNLTYTIEVTNNGPTDATNVVVEDILPGEVNHVSDTAGCVENPVGKLTCNLGNLANGASTSFDVTVQVDPSTAPGTITNNVEVSSDTPDGNPGNNTASEDTTVVAEADLSLTKDVNDGTPNVGSNVTFTISVLNSGPSTATGVTVADTLPSGYTYVSDDQGDDLADGVWTIGTIGVGNTATINVVATVNTTGDYKNVAQVQTANENDPDSTPGNDDGDQSEDDEDFATVTPNPIADLSLTKDVDNDTPDVGDNVTFTITVTNDGPSVATGVTVADTLPSGLTYVSDDQGNDLADGIWTIGTIGVGNTATINVVATVNATGDYKNVAQVQTANEDDPDSTPGNDDGDQSEDDEDFATVNPNREADLSITKSDSPDPVTAGTNLTYTITVTNNGPSGASNVVVTDTLPPEATYVSDTDSCVEGPAGTLTCSLGNLANGASTNFDVTVKVKPDTAPGTITNTVSVTSDTPDSDLTNNSTTEDTTVVTDADLSITKTDSPDPVTAGQALTYTITVTNNGPSDATNVVVTDTLPSGVTFVSSNGCAEDPNGVPICSLGNLATGAFTQYTITVTVDMSTPPGTITNTATVTSDTPDSNTNNNTATEDTTVVASADLEIDKSDDVDPVTAGNNVTYTVTVTNNGPSDAANVVVTDTLPGGVTFQSSNGCAEDPNGVPTCSLGNIASGGSKQYTITVTVNSDTPPGTITNSATVTSDTPDSNTTNNTATEDTTVIANADLEIAKSDDVDPVAAGNNVTYTVTVTNNGPSDAVNVVVTDTLPAEVTFVSSSGCAEDPNGVPTCSLGNIVSGGSKQYTITVTVKSDTAPGTITNSATVTSDTPDNTPGNNTTTEDTTVIANADLEIDKSDSPDPVTAGTSLTYTVSVTNNGPSDATNVVVTDTLPPEVTYVSDTDSCVEGPAGTLTCSLGNLASGASTNFDVTVTVKSDTAPGTITNSATVTSDTPDNTPGNNTTTENTTVIANADLEIDKTDSPDPVTAGTSLTYTITVTNNGPSDAANVVVTDTLPPEVTYVSDSDSCEVGPGTLTCPVGNLASGASTNFDVTVTVKADTAPGTITNSATVTSDTPDNTPGNNTTTENTTVVTDADLSIDKSDAPDPVAAGNSLTYTVTVTNNGPSDAVNVVVTDTLPAEVTFVSTAGCAEDPNGVPTCSLGAIAAGASKQYTISVTVNAGTPPGIITNSATVTSDTPDSNTTNNTTTENTTVAPEADITITKVDEVDPVKAGSNIVYNIGVSNAGPSTAQNIVVTDTLPPGTTFVSSSIPCVESPTGTLTCGLGNLAAGASTSFSVTVTAPATEGVITNTVVATTETADPTDNTATEDTTVDALPVIVVDKTAPATVPEPGGSVTFTVKITNNSDPKDPVTISSIKDSVYGDLTDLTTEGGTAAAQTATTCAVPQVIQPGASYECTFAAPLSGVPGNTHTNTVTVTGTDDEGNPTTDDDPHTVTIADVPSSITVSKVASPTTVPPTGGNVTYTVNVRNTSAVDTVTVASVVDDKFGDISASCGTLPTALAPNATLTCTFTRFVTLTNGAHTNVVTVTGTDDDGTPVTGSDPVTVTSTPRIDLELTATFSPTTVALDTDPATAATEQTNLTVTVTNQGPSAATNAAAVITIPSQLSYVTHSCTQASGSPNANCTYTPSSGLLLLGTIPAGQTATLVVTLGVTQAGAFTAVGEVTNAGEVDVDSTPGNNILSEDDQDDATVTATQVLASGTVGDFVFNDLNKNGVADPGEPGIPGVQLQLTTITTGGSGRQLVARSHTTTTNSAGIYLFTALPIGTYRVDVVGGVPAGFAPTTPTSSTVTLRTDGDSALGADFGYAQETLPVTGLSVVRNIEVGLLLVLVGGALVLLANRRMRRNDEAA